MDKQIQLNEDYLMIRHYYHFDTNRSIFIKGDKIEFRNIIPIEDFSDARKSGKVNNVSIYEKAQLPKNIKNYMNKIKELANGIGSEYRRKLVVKQIATSYGYVNDNYRYYHPDSIVDNAKTFYKPTPVPVIFNHNRYDASKVGGRVMFAHPIKYQVDKSAISDLRIPKMAIISYSLITEPNMIDGIMDNRYLQISAGFGANKNTAVCSICGASVVEGCEHIYGSYYDGKLAYLICHDMRYFDLSYVTIPADEWSKNIEWEIVENDESLSDKKSVQSISSDKFEFNISDPVSLYYIDDSDANVWLDLRDFKEVKLQDIFGNNYICEGDICQIASDMFSQNINDDKDMSKSNGNNKNKQEESENVEKEEEEEEEMDKCKKKGKDGKCNKKGKDSKDNDENNKDIKDNDNIKIEEQQENVEDDYMKSVIATLGIISSLLDNDAIDKDDAISALKDNGVVILYFNEDGDSITKDKLREQIDNYLYYIYEKDGVEEDKKLTTKERKALPSSAFCGPGRSFPVPDCAHATAALRLLGRSKYSESTKKKIAACIRRKQKALGCNKNSKK